MIVSNLVWRMMNEIAHKLNRHHFFISNRSNRGTTAMDTNDSILEQVQSYGTLNERNAAFVAQLAEIEEQASSSSTVSNVESMTRAEVLQGLQDDEIDLHPSAENAFYQAATSTRMQFVSRFPGKMTYPIDSEKWILAMGRTPTTRIPFVKLALAFYHELTLSQPSISATTVSVEQINALAEGAASELITEPTKQEVFQNLSAVSGVPIRSERPRIDFNDLF